MNNTTNTIPDGYVEDAKGHLVPIGMLTEYDKLKDEFILGIVAQAEAISCDLEAFKKSVINDTKALVDTARNEYGIKNANTKGNITISTFDGRYQVAVRMNDTLEFNEKLAIAKEQIDEYLRELTENAPDELKMLVAQAFEVDKKGNVSTSKVLPLLRLPIHHEKWEKAMLILKESITVSGSKAYIHIKKRDDATGEMKVIPLDSSKIQ